MNVEVERIVFGAWLFGEHTGDIAKFKDGDFPVYGKLFKSVRKYIKDDMLDSDILRAIFRISKESDMSVADLMTLRSEYADLGKYSYDTAIEGIMEYNLKAYISGINENTPITQIQARVNGFIENKKNSLPAPAKDWHMALLSDLDERQTRPIINTGIPKLDKLMCGLRRTELTSIGARPSVGKSAFALQVALNVVKQGHKVLYFPLEMSTMQTAERILVSKLSNPIPNERLKKGDIKREEWFEISKAMDEIHALVNEEKFLIFEGENNIHVIEKLVKEHKPFLVVIDQLEQLNSRIKFKDKRERFSFMTNSLKRLAMKEKIAVLLAAQLNRNAQKSEPTMAELKESGSIEEDSDNVILLHRKRPEDMDRPEDWDNTRRPVYIKLEKNRSGETGDTLTQYLADRFRFYEITDA